MCSACPPGFPLTTWSVIVMFGKNKDVRCLSGCSRCIAISDVGPNSKGKDRLPTYHFFGGELLAVSFRDGKVNCPDSCFTLTERVSTGKIESSKHAEKGQLGGWSKFMGMARGD